MTPLPEQLVEASDIEKTVADYLADHPEFFQRHQDLLLSLQLPHASGGAVSLIERQLAGLRQECAGYRKKLDDLIEQGRKNDLLISRLHRLTLALIDAANLSEVLTALEDHLHDQFQADAVELHLLAPAELDEAAAPNQGGAAQFRKLFAQGKPQCGRLTKGQLEYLFGGQAEDIRSAAVIALRSEGITGMLAIGSTDERRFEPDMGTDFLSRLGELVSKRLEIVSGPGA